MNDKACIICLNNDRPESVEHIVPRSLGNIHYVLRKGIVCQQCNSRFSRSEAAVLNSDEWLRQRKSYGVVKQTVNKSRKPLKETHLEKFLLKMCFESLYFSRNELFQELNLEPVRKYLNGGAEPEIYIHIDKKLKDSKPIPRFFNRWRLRRNHIHLRYKERDNELWFEFVFGSINRVVELRL